MESKPLVVVGAGVSGTAAAVEAAKAGVQVTLIDENPIGMSMMGLDVPQFFGQRIMGTLPTRPRCWRGWLRLMRIWRRR